MILILNPKFGEFFCLFLSSIETFIEILWLSKIKKKNKSKERRRRKKKKKGKIWLGIFQDTLIRWRFIDNIDETQLTIHQKKLNKIRKPKKFHQPFTKNKSNFVLSRNHHRSTNNKKLYVLKLQKKISYFHAFKCIFHATTLASNSKLQK